MTSGRWKSATTPARYAEAEAAGKGAVAHYYRGTLRGRCHHSVPGLTPTMG